jgi:hypothetical protein
VGVEAETDLAVAGPRPNRSCLEILEQAWTGGLPTDLSRVNALDARWSTPKTAPRNPKLSAGTAVVGRWVGGDGLGEGAHRVALIADCVDHRAGSGLFQG